MIRAPPNWARSLMVARGSVKPFGVRSGQRPPRQDLHEHIAQQRARAGVIRERNQKECARVEQRKIFAQCTACTANASRPPSGTDQLRCLLSSSSLDNALPLGRNRFADQRMRRRIDEIDVEQPARLSPLLA